MRIPDRQAALEAFYREHLADDPRPPTRHGSEPGGGSVGSGHALTDDEVVRLAESAKNGDEFRAVYRGGGEFRSGSERDMSLASRLAFYTQDAAQIERIMRGSGCVRDKWDKHRTYLRDTVARALEGLMETYAPPSKRMKGPGERQANFDAEGDRVGSEGAGVHDPFAFYDLTAAPTEPPEMLVPGFVVRGLVHSIYSGGGTGKTWVALYIVAQALLGGHRVIYADKENGPRIMRERLGLLGVGPEKMAGLGYLNHPNAGLELAEQWAWKLDEFSPDLVVFDSWVGYLGACGLDENSAVDIAAWTEAYAAPARTRGIAVLIIDHTVKNGNNKTARGSSRKLDYVDVQYEQSATPFDRDTLGQITLSKRKDREAVLPGLHVFKIGGEGALVAGSINAPTRFVLEPVDAPMSPEPGAGLTEGERKSLQALDDGMRASEWQHARSDIAEGTFFRHRKALIDAGLVEQRKDTYHHAGGSSHSLSPNSHGSDESDRQSREHRSHHSHYPKGESDESAADGPVPVGMFSADKYGWGEL